MRLFIVFSLLPCALIAQSKVSLNPFPPGSGLQLTPSSGGGSGTIDYQSNGTPLGAIGTLNSVPGTGVICTPSVGGSVGSLQCSADIGYLSTQLGINAVNAQTGTTYTIVAGDKSKLITFCNSSATAVSLPQGTGLFAAPFSFEVLNYCAGAVTITPTTSTINNGAATLVLLTGQGAGIITDPGGNYQVIRTNGVQLSPVVPEISNYQITAADFAANTTFTSSGTFNYTLPASLPPQGAQIWVDNAGAGTVSVLRNGNTINGGAISLTLSGNAGVHPASVRIVSDGTTGYWTDNVVSPIAGNTCTSNQAVTAIAANTAAGTCSTITPITGATAGELVKAGGATGPLQTISLNLPGNSLQNFFDPSLQHSGGMAVTSGGHKTLFYVGNSTAWNPTSWYAEWCNNQLALAATTPSIFVYAGMSPCYTATTSTAVTGYQALNSGGSIEITFGAAAPGYAVGDLVLSEPTGATLTSFIGTGVITANPGAGGSNTIDYQLLAINPLPSSGSLVSSGGYFTNSLVNLGYNGASSTAINSLIPGLLNTYVLPGDAVMVRGPLINDVRLGACNLACATANIKTLLASIIAAIPANSDIIWKTENSLLLTDPTNSGFVSPLGSSASYTSILQHAPYEVLSETLSRAVFWDNMQQVFTKLGHEFSNTVTATTTSSCTLSSTTLTVASGTGIVNGNYVEVGTAAQYFPVGTTVSSGGGTTSLVMSQACTTAVPGGTATTFQSKIPWYIDILHPDTLAQSREAQNDIGILYSIGSGNGFPKAGPSNPYVATAANGATLNGDPVATMNNIRQQVGFDPFMEEDAQDQSYGTCWTIYYDCVLDTENFDLIAYGIVQGSSSTFIRFSMPTPNNATAVIQIRPSDIVWLQGCAPFQPQNGFQQAAFNSGGTTYIRQISSLTGGLIPTNCIFTGQNMVVMRQHSYNIGDVGYFADRITYPDLHYFAIPASGTNFFRMQYIDGTASLASGLTSANIFSLPAGCGLITSGTSFSQSSSSTIQVNVTGSFAACSGMVGWVTGTEQPQGNFSVLNSTLSTGLVNTVASSTTPAYNLALGNIQYTAALAANATMTVSNITVGATYTFVICQDGTGSRTFTWAASIHGAMTIGSTASTCNSQSFYSPNGTVLYATSPGVVNQ